MDGQPPVEHWKGHLEVERPAQKPRRGRLFYAIIGAASLAGLLALGGFALWSEVAHSPDVFAWCVVIVSVACVVVVAAFLLPLPVYFSTWVITLPGTAPLPLATPALAVVAFAAPSIVALIALIVRYW